MLNLKSSFFNWLLKMEYVLWAISPSGQCFIFDFSSGVILKSWNVPAFSAPNSCSLKPSVISSGILAEWLMMYFEKPRIAYFCHHSLLSGKKRPGQGAFEESICNSKVLSLVSYLQ